MQKYTKINTFSRRPSLPQLITYLLFTTEIVFFYALIQNNLVDRGRKIGTIVAFSLLTFIEIGVAFVVSLSDPSDELMVRFRNQPGMVAKEELRNVLYCDVCKSYVKLQSRHCRRCERCVQQFDHHCIWVNNCIGSKNYREFAIMIVTTFFNFAMYLIAMALLWAEGGYQGFIVQMGLVWGLGVIVAVFLLLVFKLIMFHVYIWWLGITTYDFLTQEVKGKEKEQKEKRENKEGTGDQTKLEVTEQDLNNEPRGKIQTQMAEIKQNNEKNSSPQQRDQDSRSPSLKIQNVLPTLKRIQPNPNPNSSSNPTLKKDKNIFENSALNDESKYQKRSEHESEKISQYFSKSRSLKVLMSSQAILPRKLKLESKIGKGEDGKDPLPNTDDMKALALGRKV